MWESGALSRPPPFGLAVTMNDQHGQWFAGKRGMDKTTRKGHPSVIHRELESKSTVLPQQVVLRKHVTNLSYQVLPQQVVRLFIIVGRRNSCLRVQCPMCKETSSRHSHPTTVSEKGNSGSRSTVRMLIATIRAVNSVASVNLTAKINVHWGPIVPWYQQSNDPTSTQGVIAFTHYDRMGPSKKQSEKVLRCQRYCKHLVIVVIANNFLSDLIENKKSWDPCEIKCSWWLEHRTIDWFTLRAAERISTRSPPCIPDLPSVPYILKGQHYARHHV
jgi:hypothetical protein